MGRWQDEGLSAPPDKEQCLHHKPKAQTRDSVAVLTIGDSLPALKTSGGKKGEEICSMLRFPRSAASRLFHLPSGSAAKHPAMLSVLVSARAQGNVSEGLNNR